MQFEKRAPEFPKSTVWLNTSKTPISLENMRGKIVLLHFWTFGCINCMHSVLHLIKLQEKYPNIAILGIHSAKFSYEQQPLNIQNAILQNEITYPVAVDSDHTIWKQYMINAWPSYILIDKKGNIKNKLIGEKVVLLEHYFKQHLKIGQKSKNLSPQYKKNHFVHRPFFFPSHVVAHKSFLYISDTNNNRILVAKLLNKTTAHIVHQIGSGIKGNKNGSFYTTQLNKPRGVCVINNLLYFCDSNNHQIKKADLKKLTVETIIGTGKQSSHIDIGNKIGLETALNSPWDLAHWKHYLFITMAGSHQIWRYNMNSKTIELFAGNGNENVIDDIRLEAYLAQPNGIIVKDNTLYFLDAETSALRKINLHTDEVKTLIGSSLFEFGLIDGTWEEAFLQHPQGLAGHHKEIYIADTYNNAIRRINIQKKTIQTIIKDGMLHEPSGIAFYKDSLYISDTNNHRIQIYDMKKSQLSPLEIN